VTEFDVRCSILGELWLNYREDEDFAGFIEYNDVGLPLAYLVSAKIAKPSGDMAIAFIDETFDLLLASLELEEDIGFESLEELLSSIE
jgi:hypothetical protein